MKTTQYQDFVAAVKATTLDRKVTQVPGSTRGSKLYVQVEIEDFGTVYLSADRRITKVVTDGRTWMRPNEDERAEVYALIGKVANAKATGTKVEVAA